MRVIALSSFLIFSLNIFSQGTWTQKANLPSVGRLAAVAFSIGSKGYIGTGFGSLAFLDDFWEYDPVTNSWTQKANFGGGPRGYAVGFEINNKGYLGTGLDSSWVAHNDWWEYDPLTNIWTQKTSLSGSPRSVAMSFAYGNTGYVGTGADGIGGQSLDDLWEYDPASDTWSQKATYLGGKRADVDRAVINVGNKIYVGTGLNSAQVALTDFWEYDPGTDSWSQMANFPGSKRAGATGFSLCSKGYLGLGSDDQQNNKNDFWIYDPLTNSWGSMFIFPGGARVDLPSMIINNRAYIGTGYTNGVPGLYYNDFWEFTVVAANISSPYSTVCHGNSVTLTATGGITYQWSNGATGNSIIVSPITTSTYSVIATNSTGCTAAAFFTMSVTPNPVANSSPNNTICNGVSVILNASGGANYLWSTGATTTSIQVNPNTTTNYSVIVSTGNCSDTAYTSVLVNPNPTANASANTSFPITYGENSTLTASGAVNYNWSNGENGNTIIVSPTSTTVYCVTASDSNNCFDTACVTLSFYDACASGIYLPNAFSPNNDDENDFLQIYNENMLCTTTLHLVICNQWGETIFETMDPAFKWGGNYNGKPLNPQVLSYYLRATLINSKEISIKGNISLIK